MTGIISSSSATSSMTVLLVIIHCIVSSSIWYLGGIGLTIAFDILYFLYTCKISPTLGMSWLKIMPSTFDYYYINENVKAFVTYKYEYNVKQKFYMENLCSCTFASTKINFCFFVGVDNDWVTCCFSWKIMLHVQSCISGTISLMDKRIKEIMLHVHFKRKRIKEICKKYQFN